MSARLLVARTIPFQSRIPKPAVFRHASTQSRALRSSSSKPYFSALGVLVAVFGAAAVVSQWPNTSKRTAALKKLETAHATSETPSPIIQKAKETAQTLLPPPAPASLLQPPSTTSSSVRGKDESLSKQVTSDQADSQSLDPSTPSTPAAGESEGEESQQAAFNPETGEINWDCPCLGGMANGPCGEEFKLAFSCFVHSEEEPKGVDCVEKFKGMQDCFRLHPDVYGAELEDNEEEHNVADSIAETASDAADSISALAKEAAAALDLDSAFNQRDSDSPYTGSIDAEAGKTAANRADQLHADTVKETSDKLKQGKAYVDSR